jgi:acyl-CoA thioester hydrolase
MRWNDLDALGHVNNALYVSYFEIARGGFMLKAVPEWDWSKHMFLIANVNVDFKSELLLTAVKPQVYVRTSRIGVKSFVLEYALTSQDGDEIIVHATGSTTQIMFDTKARASIEVPDWVRKSLEDYDML